MSEAKPPFERVVAEHSATVLRVCRAVLGAEEADDAWSETFIAAMRAYPDLPGDANLQAWLVTIAHRKAIDVTRARQRRASPVETMPSTASTIGIPGQRDDELWAALKALPDKQRQAVAYHHLGGLAYQEVAEILGGTTDAARRAAADGMKALRTSLVGSKRSKLMNTSDTALLAPLADIDAGTLARLHAGLEVAADRAGDLDIAYTTFDSPVGPLLLAATEAGLLRVAYEIEDHERVLETISARVSPRILRAPKRLDEAMRELDEYFAGRRRTFDLPLDLGLSAGFRQLVQRQLAHIAYGHTQSYGQVAEAVGNPKAVRAVGTACATNPLPVVLPCHRVLRSDGSLGGYAGGPATKALLLELEAAA